MTIASLLDDEQQRELTQLRTRFTDQKSLVTELVKRAWLTPYQATLLLKGRAEELLLGPYVVLSRLGKGGMGEVFKARHRLLRRCDAVKVISEEYLKSEDALNRFHKEIQAAAQLHHPNIVQTFGADDANGRFYLAMELVDGQDLAQQVQKEGVLGTEQACDVIRQAALGLQHIHEKGLVHRDLKPSNLMIVRDSVKILDLGLARLRDARAGKDATKTGSMVGTVEYLAPEQAEDPRAADIRADIYSLGCTFYFLLTGNPPFCEGTDAKKLLDHQQRAPKSLQSLVAGLAPQIASGAQRMLAKKPKDRFQTPQEVADWLQPFVTKKARSVSSSRVFPVGDSLAHGPAPVAEKGWSLDINLESTAPSALVADASSGAADPSSFSLPLSLSLDALAAEAGFSVATPTPALSISPFSIAPRQKKSWTLRVVKLLLLLALLATSAAAGRLFVPIETLLPQDTVTHLMFSLRAPPSGDPNEAAKLDVAQLQTKLEETNRSLADRAKELQDFKGQAQIRANLEKSVRALAEEREKKLRDSLGVVEKQAGEARAAFEKEKENAEEAAKRAARNAETAEETAGELRAAKKSFFALEGKTRELDETLKRFEKVHQEKKAVFFLTNSTKSNVEYGFQYKRLDGTWSAWEDHTLGMAKGVAHSYRGAVRVAVRYARAAGDAKIDWETMDLRFEQYDNSHGVKLEQVRVGYSFGLEDGKVKLHHLEK